MHDNTDPMETDLPPWLRGSSQKECSDEEGGQVLDETLNAESEASFSGDKSESSSHDAQVNRSKDTPRQTPLRNRKSMVQKGFDEGYPNHPHPALEFPPLYFAIRNSPALLKTAETFFRFRWLASYPLQQRVPFSRVVFRKLKIFVTWGEFIMLMPFVACVLAGMIYSFVFPSVSISGHAARTPLIFAFVTAMRNSFLTLLLGIPVERAIWYHKLAARIAFVNGIFHTYAAFIRPMLENNPNFWDFLLLNQVNSSGTMLVVFLLGMMVTTIPFIRRKFFQVFYIIHIITAAGMIACAFFHTGILIPVLAFLTWGIDIVIRKVVMALYRYPRKASVRAVSESVVEVCIPKINGFDYNPGQYIFLAIPEVSYFHWHPFSLSSSPEQKVVTLHIRRAGAWTNRLYEIAKKKTEVSILMEGPYGAVGVDLMSERYKMIMLFSGGIGVTPMQAVCNQLMYDHSMGNRNLKKLQMVWIERDPNMMQKVDVVRRSSSYEDFKELSKRDLQADVESNADLTAENLASILLALVPESQVTDAQLEELYPTAEFSELFDLTEATPSFAESSKVFSTASFSIKEENNNPEESVEGNFYDSSDAGSSEGTSGRDDTLDQSFLDDAYQFDSESKAEVTQEVLDLQVYVTAKSNVGDLALRPFVKLGRPDIKAMFRQMRDEAIAQGEKRVAVCICAPQRLIEICQKACAKFSDSKVTFDFHSETFG